MAVASTIVWELNASGSANNGGGFNSAAGGTDRSISTTPFKSFADLASTNGTNATPTVTSGSYSFVSADVGNIIKISAGTNWTVGWYEITSISGSGAVLDKACGSTATLSSGTWVEGGALALGTIGSDSLWGSTLVAGNKIWMKNGSHTLGQATTSTAGSVTAPIIFEGYNVTRGDAPTGSTRPTLACGANIFTFGASTQIKNIIFTGSSTSVISTGASNIITQCKCINTSTTAARNAFNVGGATTILQNCEAISYRGRGIFSGNNVGCVVSGCYIHDSDTGVANTSSMNIINSVIESCVTAAISTTGGMTFSNTIYGSENKTGIGVSINASATPVSIFSNIIYGFVTGISASDAVNNRIDGYNTYYNNTTDVTNWTKQTADQTINPSFANVSQITGTTATTSGSVLTQSGADFSTVTDNRDFCYISSGTGITAGQYLITGHTTTTLTLDIAPGTSAVADKHFQITTGRNFAISSALKDLGYPSAFPAALFTNYSYIGAVGRQAVFTDPGIANVRLSTTYTYDGALETGTLDLPSIANVKIGVVYDNTTKTGTYDGSDRWTDPGDSNVRIATAYKANSVTNNKTGRVTLPTAVQVKTGVTFDTDLGTTGTYDGSDRWTDPGDSNVRLSTAYKANSLTNNKTGRVTIPTAGQVKIGVTFETDAGTTGTYDGSDRWTDPGSTNVKLGTTYKANSLTNNETGSYSPTPLPQTLNSGLNIDSSNNLNGPLWVTLDSAIVTSGLGTAAYEIFNPDGTTTGISESAITDTSGLFFITPVSVTSLIGKPNYLIKVSITVSSILYVNYIELSLMPSTVTTSHFDSVIGTPTGASIAADIAEVEAETDGIAAIPTNPLLTTDTRLNHLDADISTRLATSGYTAPDNTDIVAIKAKTDNLPATPASQADVNAVPNKTINGLIPLLP